jgi:DedD protein
MGLFSNKNKRDRAAEDSGRFYSKDDDAAIGERARAKRASNAGATAGGPSRRPGNDPMLPEKKRARRRLVGAIALALAAAVGLPMLLDSEPKQLAGDIAIQIPSKDKAAPLPAPAAPAPAPATEDKDSAVASAPAKAPTRPKTVAAADSVDQGEEVIDAPPPTHKTPKVEARKPEPKPHTVAELPKPEHKESRPEHKEAKAEKPERKPEPIKPKLEDKPVKPHEDTRALAILEGKPVAKPAEPKAEATGGPKAMVQVAAMSSEEKAAEVQAKLRAAGISSSTEKSANGLVRVKIGPYTRDEAEKARAKVAKLGL